MYSQKKQSYSTQTSEFMINRHTAPVLSKVLNWSKRHHITYPLFDNEYKKLQKYLYKNNIYKNNLNIK